MSAFSTCPEPNGARVGAWALALALGLAATATPLGALDGDRALSQYIRDRWSNLHGFPGGPVYEITQSADGYLWIAADKGLVRFDGLTFRLLEPPGAASHRTPTVIGVAAAADGSVWARLRGTALVRYADGAFENLLPTLGIPESIVSAMRPGAGGAMLLATLREGPISYRDGRVHAIGSPRDVPSSSFVIAMAEVGSDVWLGTRDAGLLRVRGQHVTRLTAGLPDLKINALLPFPDGSLLIGTDRGVIRWDGTTITTSGVPDAVRSQPALAMLRDRQGNVWIAAGARGLIRVAADGRVDAASPGDAAPDHVSTVFEDRDGNLWVGTSRGIERWRDAVFTTYSASEGLPSGGIGPVFVDARDNVWFAPTDGGLFRLRHGAAEPIRVSGLDRDIVYSIDGGGDELWIGRQQGGLTRLDLRSPGLTPLRLRQADGLAQDNVYVVHRAHDGTLWAGTLTGGASHYEHGAFTTYTTRDGLASNTVAAIADSADGTTWFGTPNGLSALSHGRWRTYTVDDGLPADDVNTLFEDDAGVLWIGTAGGLAALEDGTLKALTEAPGLERQAVLGMAVDRAGSLWLKTSDRVLRVERDALLRGAPGQVDGRDYGLPDGLLGLDSVKRHRTLVTDARGRLWFALSVGLAVADPWRAGRDSLPALVHVEDVSADGEPVDLARPLRIPSTRQRLTFSFAGLSLAVPERVRFRYRLDGFDRDWSPPLAARQAVYTNLAPGAYRFRLIASNSDGLWNGTEVSLPFDVEPTFWQTTRFRILAGLLLAAVAAGAYRLRLRSLGRQLNVRFEERLAERTRIAQELHDTLLQGFVSASMQLHVAADSLPAESPARPALGRVLDLMARVIEEARNAVKGLRSPVASDQDLAQAFAQLPEESPGGAMAGYQVIVEGHTRPLQPLVRDEVYRIGREALVNAVRHAQATNIEVEFQYGPREFRLFVRDDGRGIDPAVVQARAAGHWGITGMHERAGRIGGTIRIRSRAAAGTEVEFRMPARLAFDRAGTASAQAQAGGRGAPAAGAARREQSDGDVRENPSLQRR